MPSKLTDFNFGHQIVSYRGTMTVKINGYVFTCTFFEGMETINLAAHKLHQILLFLDNLLVYIATRTKWASSLNKISFEIVSFSWNFSRAHKAKRYRWLEFLYKLYFVRFKFKIWTKKGPKSLHTLVRVVVKATHRLSPFKSTLSVTAAVFSSQRAGRNLFDRKLFNNEW